MGKRLSHHLGYVKEAEVLLTNAGAEAGDTIKLTTEDGRVLEGVLMPRHDLSGEDIVTIKLASGYNAGVRVGGMSRVELLKRAGRRPAAPLLPESAAGRPRVELLGTGGTIASYVDYRTGAVHPAATADELAGAVPEIFGIADVRPRVVFQVFSEDMTPKDWQKLAREVADAFRDGARGVVIPHGTDTMGLTAAALSFMLRDLPGPVVLVGAQRSSDRPSSDAAMNLLAAVRVAATADVGEVIVAMHESTSDERVALHRGTRVRKLHTSRRDAFRSVNVPPVGFVSGEKVELAAHARPASRAGLKLLDRLEEDVGLLWSFPGLTGKHLEGAAGRGVVVAGTGLGHIAQRLLPDVARLVQKGRFMAMASQCIHGRVDMKVYSTGRDLLAAGMVPAHDMLPETAYVKLLWVLGNAKDRDEARRLFETDLVGEIAERTPVDSFGEAV